MQEKAVRALDIEISITPAKSGYKITSLDGKDCEKVMRVYPM